jgi:hypothetical protein
MSDTPRFTKARGMQGVLLGSRITESTIADTPVVKLYMHGAWIGQWYEDQDTWAFDLPDNAHAVAAWWAVVAKDFGGDFRAAFARLTDQPAA